MSSIIFSCNNGLPIEGIVALKESLHKTKIFVDDPENLIGFRTSLKHYTDILNNQVVQYIEIGYFMEMLYGGSYEAFKILKMDKKHIDFELYDFDILRKRESDLVSRALVDSLVEDAKVKYGELDNTDNMYKTEKIKNNFIVEKLAYNNRNAYICLRNLILAESVLRHETFDLSKIDNAMLQGVRDGRFSFSAIKDGYDMYMGNIKKLEESSNLPLTPDSNILHNILMDIRNVKVETLNVTLG